MKKIENAVIKSVQMGDNNQSVEIVTAKDGVAYSVNYHLGKYNTEDKTFAPDPETESKRREQVQNDLGVTWEELNTLVGKEVVVYQYDGFNSFHEVNYAEPFQESEVDQLVELIINNIYYNPENSIRFVGEEVATGKLRSAKFGFTVKIGDEYLIDEQKKQRQLDKIKKISGHSIEELQNSSKNLKLTGQVKSFNGFTYLQTLKIEEVNGTISDNQPAEPKPAPVDDGLPF